jgi:hypothetical protein
MRGEFSLGFGSKIALAKEDNGGSENGARLRQLRYEVDEGKGAVMRVTYTDARRGAKQADLCDTCAGGTPGRAVARRGRKPKSATV